MKIPPSTVRNKLALLKNAGFLDIKSNNKFSIVTICNYSDYQDVKERNGQQIGQPKDSQRTTKGQPEDNQRTQTTIQPLNNENNVTMKTNKVLFTPPTLEEVSIYCQTRNNDIDAQTFMDFYQARGWKFKTGQPVKDWKACVRTWEARERKPIEKLTDTQKRNIANFNDWEKRHLEGKDGI